MVKRTEVRQVRTPAAGAGIKPMLADTLEVRSVDEVKLWH